MKEFMKKCITYSWLFRIIQMILILALFKNVLIFYSSNTSYIQTATDIIKIFGTSQSKSKFRMTKNGRKAYVITLHNHIDKDLEDSLVLCGFHPILVDAIRPIFEFKSKENFTHHCFGNILPNAVKDMSLGEIALVGSHRKALQLVANDDSISDDSWALILEDDARFVNPDNSTCDLINTFFNYQISNLNDKASKNSKIDEKEKTNFTQIPFLATYGFAYFGLKQPICRKVSTDGIFGDECYGLDAHAYAITKHRAKTFFNEVNCRSTFEEHFNHEILCGEECSVQLCQADQSYERHWRLHLDSLGVDNVKVHAVLIGLNMHSPDIAAHKGLMYQCCREDIAKVTGTSLKKFDVFLVDKVQVHKSSCYKLSLSAHEQGQMPGDMQRQVVEVGQPAVENKGVRVGVGVEVGDIMFQYAILAAMCVMKDESIRSCASISLATVQTAGVHTVQNSSFKAFHSSSNSLINDFLNTFNISLFDCPSNGIIYTENPKESHAIAFDEAVHTQPFRTTLSGVFKSWKYFHPLGHSDFLETFRFPSSVTSQVDVWLGSLKKKSTAAHSQRQQQQRLKSSPTKPRRLVCIHVQLGDKLRNFNMNKPTSTSTSTSTHYRIDYEYYASAIELLIQRHGTEKLLFVLFDNRGTGGNSLVNSKERLWLRRNVTGKFWRQLAGSVRLAPTWLSNMQTLYAMSRCDSLVLSCSSSSWWSAFLADSERGYLATGSQSKTNVQYSSNLNLYSDSNSNSNRYSNSSNPTHVVEVIAPKYLYSIPFEPSDYYFPHWTLIDDEQHPKFDSIKLIGNISVNQTIKGLWTRKVPCYRLDMITLHDTRYGVPVDRASDHALWWTYLYVDGYSTGSFETEFWTIPDVVTERSVSYQFLFFEKNTYNLLAKSEIFSV